MSENPDAPIRLTTGEPLAVTQGEYDAARQPFVRERMASTGVRTICNAPFTSLMFDQIGRVYLCNHAFIPIAQVTKDFSILECWNGPALRTIREQFMRYELHKDICVHCVRQIDSQQHRECFPLIQFDHITPDSAQPKYPKRLLLYLGNTCNLACVMCNGILSSRHRKEIEKLPPIQSPYGEKFFQELEEILPHTEHLEFFGGEPFLVREHMRIFELLEKTNSQCTLYVNTNATAFHPKALHYLETLNFVTVAISMDAVNPRLHAEVRYGLDSDKFLHNVKYLLRLRKQRQSPDSKKPPLSLMLNVTEHRKNWFELPEIFRFAERRQLYIHINTCVHPANVTLYTLPTDELRYIHEYFLIQQKELEKEFHGFGNRASYQFLVNLTQKELENRGPDWDKKRPAIPEGEFSMGRRSDGRIAVPIPGAAPFDTCEKLMREIARMEQLNEVTRHYLYESLLTELNAFQYKNTWKPAISMLEELMEKVA